MIRMPTTKRETPINGRLSNRCSTSFFPGPRKCTEDHLLNDKNQSKPQQAGAGRCQDYHLEEWELGRRPPSEREGKKSKGFQRGQK